VDTDRASELLKGERERLEAAIAELAAQAAAQGDEPGD
jgi:hypothetical protein